MSVDLSTGQAGIIKFSTGEIFYCMNVTNEDSCGCMHNPDEYGVRIESGWYNTYTRDGKPICAGVLHKKDGSQEKVRGKREIIEFIPCAASDPRAEGLQSEITP